MVDARAVFRTEGTPIRSPARRRGSLQKISGAGMSPRAGSNGLQRAMGTRPHAPAHRRMLVVVLGAVLLAGACSDANGDDEVADPTTVTSSTTSTTEVTTTQSTTTTTAADPSAEVEGDVEAAFRAATDAYVAASAVSDPDAPELLATHTGPMLEQNQNLLRARRANGERGEIPPGTQLELDVDEIELDATDPAVARLHFCLVDPARVLDSNGAVIRQGPVTVEGRAAMQLVDDTWRLAEQVFDRQDDGVVGCAVD